MKSVMMLTKSSLKVVKNEKHPICAKKKSKSKIHIETGLVFGSDIFDPKLILSQIAALQSIFYSFFAGGVYTALTIYSLPRKIKVLFSGNDFSDTPYSIVYMILIIISPIIGIATQYIVERAKKCLDFIVTTYFIHILACWILYGFPSSFSFWCIIAVCIIISTAVAEYLSAKAELKDIKLRPRSKHNSKAVHSPEYKPINSGIELSEV